MTQEPQKSNTVLIVIAIIGVIGTIVATTIGVIGNYNIEKLRQDTELTRIALVSIATQGGETQVLMASTISAPTDIPTPIYEIVVHKNFENGNLSDFNIANPSIARIIETGKTGRGVAIKKLNDSEDFYIAMVLPQQAKTGEVYKAKVQCKAPIGFYCRIFLGDVISDSGEQYENNVSISVQGTGDWIEVETGALIMKNDDFLTVYIYGDNNEIEILYDNLEVVKLP